MAVQRPPQPPGFHPHNRIDLRVEILAAPQCLDGYRMALDAVTFAAQGRLDNKPKNRNELRRMPQHIACNDAVQSGANLLGPRVSPGRNPRATKERFTRRLPSTPLGHVLLPGFIWGPRSDRPCCQC